MEFIKTIVEITDIGHTSWDLKTMI